MARALLLALATLISAACVRPGPAGVLPRAGGVVTPTAAAAEVAAASGASAAHEAARNDPIAIATPDAVAAHTVQLGETINSIAAQYSLQPADLLAENDISDASLLLPGRVLRLPAAGSTAVPDLGAPATPLIPDAELVYGPTVADFDLEAFVSAYEGYLLSYEEEVEGQPLSGPEIVQLVAERHSVNPRLLLAALEFNAGWLTQAQPQEIDYPLGKETEGLEGLYKQLSWAANQLNWGFYGRAEGGLSTLTIAEDQIVSISDTASLGTVGVQNYLAARDGITVTEWRADASPEGFLATYRELFGDPFANGDVPLLPDDLSQPALLLPWASGETWYFSGGPHGGWNTGSAWAALDFVPPDVNGGCFQSEAWVTAVAPGEVTRSGFGAVVVDLDGDGYAGTGWAITYMHLDSRDRIAAGEQVAAGDRLGHASCEGGFTNGTHVHLARTYNGRWISADGALPFVLGGWVSQGAGYEYNGWLVRGDETKTADVLRSDDNAITAD